MCYYIRQCKREEIPGQKEQRRAESEVSTLEDCFNEVTTWRGVSDSEETSLGLFSSHLSIRLASIPFFSLSAEVVT